MNILDEFAAEVHAKLCASDAHTQTDARELLRNAFGGKTPEELAELLKAIDQRYQERLAEKADSASGEL